MIAYTVTRRAGDVETSVRVEVPDDYADRDEVFRTAIDEVFPPEDAEEKPFRREDEALMRSNDAGDYEDLERAIECIGGVLFARAVFPGGAPEVWVRLQYDTAAIRASVEDRVKNVHVALRYAIDGAVLAAADTEKVASLRARIASDHAVFTEIASLLENVTGGDNVHAAGALAKRAASLVVPK